MMCPVCSAPTSVKDTRPTDDGTVKRRRVCDCGAKFETIERRANTDNTLARRAWSRSYQKARYHNKSIEERRSQTLRKRLRAEARQEAAETGAPVEQVYAQWGVQ